MTPEQYRQPIKEETHDPASHGLFITLTSPDGRVIRVRDGDVVGRTAVGREVLEMH